MARTATGGTEADMKHRVVLHTLCALMHSPFCPLPLCFVCSMQCTNCTISQPAGHCGIAHCLLDMAHSYLKATHQLTERHHLRPTDNGLVAENISTTPALTAAGLADEECHRTEAEIQTRYDVRRHRRHPYHFLRKEPDCRNIVQTKHRTGTLPDTYTKATS